MKLLLSLWLVIFSQVALAQYAITNQAGHYAAPILAGQTILVGNVVISNSNDELIITTTSDSVLKWFIQKVHIYVSAIEPVLNNPSPGQFPYQSISYSPPVSNYEYRIPLSDLNIDCSGSVFMAIHFEMVRLNNAGAIVQSETGWSYGPNLFNTPRWGWQFKYQAKCEEVAQLVGCSKTQGYWKTHSKYSKPKTIPWFKAPLQIMASEDLLLCSNSWSRILGMAPKGDAWLILAHQFIAAKLNSFTGASVPPQINLNVINSLLLSNCAGARSSSVVGQEMLIYAGILAAYNEGDLGIPHCQ